MEGFGRSVIYLYANFHPPFSPGSHVTVLFYLLFTPRLRLGVGKKKIEEGA